ncbi:hypothetical protein ScPMuIL_015987, partial [Solemya velum]
SISIDIIKAPNWNSYISLSTDSLCQIQFWNSKLHLIKSRKMFESNKYSKIVYSDASNTGYAGFEVNTVNGVSHGMWTVEESNKSSTWRELEA